MKNIRVTRLSCTKNEAHHEIAHLIAEQLDIMDIQINKYTCTMIAPKSVALCDAANVPQLNSQHVQGVTTANAHVQSLIVIVTFVTIYRRREVYYRKRHLMNTDIFFSED